MKINHKTIRDVLKAIGIAIFIISVFIKLRKIFIYGGTRVVKVDEDGDEIQESMEVNAEEFDEAIPVTKYTPDEEVTYESCDTVDED